MKNKDYKFQSFLWKVRKNNKPGKMWSLSGEYRERLLQLGYVLEPALFRIPTRRLRNYRATNNKLLRELHHASKAKKPSIVRFLSEEEMRILDDRGYRYYPYKYFILRHVK